MADCEMWADDENKETSVSGFIDTETTIKMHRILL